MTIVLFFLVLPIVLLLLTLRGYLNRTHTVYILTLAITLIFFSESVHNLTSNKRKPVDTKSTREFPPSYMGYESGWWDPVFGSAGGGSTKNTTIQKWISPVLTS